MVQQNILKELALVFFDANDTYFFGSVSGQEKENERVSMLTDEQTDRKRIFQVVPCHFICSLSLHKSALSTLFMNVDPLSGWGKISSGS